MAKVPNDRSDLNVEIRTCPRFSIFSWRGFLSVLAGVIFLNTCWAVAGDAAVLVPRQASGRPVPQVDGLCAASEYAPGWRTSFLFYAPRYGGSLPARVNLISTATDLYVCLDNLPRQLGTVTPFVSLAFDTARDGGEVPIGDDVRFSLVEGGGLDADRGNGSGAFVDDPSLSHWQAEYAVRSEFSWIAEFRIPLVLLGGGRPLDTIGFHVRHNWLRFQGDDFALPPSAGWNVPRTWMRLTWLPPPAPGAGEILVDQFRMTQGLDIDVRAAVSHRLIIRKDTLVIAQLYRLGSVPTVDLGSECVLTQPAAGVTVRVPLTPGSIKAGPSGYFDGTWTFQCAVPGAMLSPAGTWRIEMEIPIVGELEPRRVFLGTRTISGAPDLNLFVVRDTFAAVGVPIAIPWNSAIVAAIPRSMEEAQRIMPLPEETRWLGPAELVGPAVDAGIRYTVHPVALRCESDDSFDECEDRFRSVAEELIHHYNADLAASGSSVRFDFPLNLAAGTSPGGGQADSSYTPCNTSSGISASGGSDATGAVIAHEVAHCLGQVRASSPNWNTIGNHAASRFIPRTLGFAGYDTGGPFRIATPESNMFRNVGNSPSSLMEGFEWNDVHTGLTALFFERSLALSEAAFGSAPTGSPASDFYALSVRIEADDTVTIGHAYRTTVALDPTPEDLASEFSAVFRNGSGGELSRIRFAAESDEQDVSDGDPTTKTLFLVFPLPVGAASFEIENSGVVVEALSFSAQGPQVGPVSAAENGGTVAVNWSASDPDSSALTYSLFLQLGSGQPLQLLDAGLAHTSYAFDADLVPATSNARITVEAQDGFHTARGVSGPITIPAKPPIVSILTPPEDRVLVDSRPIRFLGTAVDVGAGTLDTASFDWTSDLQGALGSGTELRVPLVAGVHLVTLSATAPSGLAATDTVQVFVFRDGDGDERSDLYELSHVCLSAVSSADSDPDEDGLDSSAEELFGSDPCAPDSDVDGVGDADEVRFGSDPGDAADVPKTELFVAPDRIDLGTCPAPSTVPVTVQTAPGGSAWHASAGAEWLTLVSGPDGSLEVSADCTGLVEGNYASQVLVGDGEQVRALQLSLSVAGFGCPTAPLASCRSGFASGLLKIDEKKGGSEKLIAKLLNGPQIAAGDLGTPATGSTAYALCIYDDAGALAGALTVDRASNLCGEKSCWKRLGKAPPFKGFRYLDKSASADGVLVIKLKAGGVGKSKIIVKGRNDSEKGMNSLPTGLAAGLRGSSGAVVQLVGSDAPACLSMALNQVVVDDGLRFKAK
jgi:hypothetical protein